MASEGNSSVNSEKIFHRYTGALSAALFEWLLIFMLLIDAMVSYLITKFARNCKLQTPCLLCSRLDHVLGKEKMKFYWDLVCGVHKLEISSLVYCHSHNKLVDVHGMCESCLFSFVTVNKSNSETYRLLVSKLGEDSGFGHEDHKPGHATIRQCSCCNEPWIPKGYIGTLIPTQSNISQASEFDLPLSVPECTEDNQKSRYDNASVSVKDTDQSKIGSDPQYKELNSDSESEVSNHAVDGEDVPNSETEHLQKDIVDQHVLTECGTINLLDNFAMEKLVDPVSAFKPSTLILESQPDDDIIVSLGTTSVEITHSSGNSLEELNRKLDPASKPSTFISDSQQNNDIIVSLGTTCVNITNSSGNGLEEINRKLDPVSASNPSTVISESQSDDEIIVSLGTTSLEITDSSGNGLEELNWKEASKETQPSAPELIISLNDIPFSSNGREVSVDVSTEINLNSVDEVPPLSNAGELLNQGSENSNLISHDYTPSSTVGNQTPVEVPKESKPFSINDVSPSNFIASSVEESKKIGVTETLEADQKSVIESEEICTPREKPPPVPESPVGINHVTSQTSIQVTSSLDLSDAYKLAVSSRGRQLSGLLVEQWVGKDSFRLSEDLKVLLSQLSAARGTEQSMSDASPRVAVSPRISVHSDELKNSDVSAFNGMQILQKRMSLERNESGLSLDGSIVSEIEGETAVDRLKRQVEHDRKLLHALYKELEEERNASAIAANQAMAMITRLQEEKATLHMEALQNLRMMEGQAEYDMEALQNTNDLLAEKEKEIQDLESELEFYRMKFSNDLKATKGSLDHSEANGIYSEERAKEETNDCCTGEEKDQSFVDTNK